MAIQMIGAAAPYIASSVGSVVISASLAILIDKISVYVWGQIYSPFQSYREAIIAVGTVVTILGLGALGSYAWTSLFVNGRNFETLAKAANVTLSLIASFGGLLLSYHQIPNIPVNKAKTN